MGKKAYIIAYDTIDLRDTRILDEPDLQRGTSHPVPPGSLLIIKGYIDCMMLIPFYMWSLEPSVYSFSGGSFYM